MCYSGNGHRRFELNNHQVRQIAEAAFKARFGDIDIVRINAKPGFDHDDDPMPDVKIIYDGEAAPATPSSTSSPSPTSGGATR